MRCHSSPYGERGDLAGGFPARASPEGALAGTRQRPRWCPSAGSWTPPAGGTPPVGLVARAAFSNVQDVDKRPFTGVHGSIVGSREALSPVARVLRQRGSGCCREADRRVPPLGVGSLARETRARSCMRDGAGLEASRRAGMAPMRMPTTGAANRGKHATHGEYCHHGISLNSGLFGQEQGVRPPPVRRYAADDPRRRRRSAASTSGAGLSCSARWCTTSCRTSSVATTVEN